MSPFLRTWSILVVTLGYLVAVHLAFLRASSFVAATAVAFLVLLVLASIKGRHRAAWRALVAVPGIAIVLLTARGAPPLLLMLPPVVLPALMALVFGHTLMPGRTPLIERFARGFYAPVVPGDDVIAYARGVTWAWTLLLALVALINAALAVNLTPGGLLELAGIAPVWPVSRGIFVWFSNTGTYLLFGAMFVVEFMVRVRLFPDHDYLNPLDFVREVRTRLPNIVAALRHG